MSKFVVHFWELKRGFVRLDKTGSNYILAKIKSGAELAKVVGVVPESVYGFKNVFQTIG